MDEQEINWTEFAVPDKILSFETIKPDYNICFHNNGKEIGKLDFNGPALVFTGDAEESAKMFIDLIGKWFADRLEEERKAEREACAVIAETPISGEQDDITMQAKDRVAAAIRARGENT